MNKALLIIRYEEEESRLFMYDNASTAHRIGAESLGQLNEFHELAVSYEVREAD